MSQQINPEMADYNRALQMFRTMETARKRMNDASIGGSKRKKALQKFKEYHGRLTARNYCTVTPPKTK
jgi:hypothetical protein